MSILWDEETSPFGINIWAIIDISSKWKQVLSKVNILIQYLCQKLNNVYIRSLVLEESRGQWATSLTLETVSINKHVCTKPQLNDLDE